MLQPAQAKVVNLSRTSHFPSGSSNRAFPGAAAQRAQTVENLDFFTSACVCVRVIRLHPCHEVPLASSL